MRKDELLDRIQELEDMNRKLRSQNKELLQELGLKTLKILELKRIHTREMDSLYNRLNNLCIYLNEEARIDLGSLNEEQIGYLSEEKKNKPS